MRPVHALVGLALIAGACADDDGTEGTGTGATQEDVMPDETTGDETTPDDTTPDETPERTTPAGPPTTGPDAADRPSSTLELNPPKTSAPTPPTTSAGPPAGGDESLFPGQFDPGLDPFVELATADLAVRLDVDEDEITVISATLVTWPDSSIGCPLPGMQYLQVLQDGSLIELGHDGTVYRYHTGGTRITPFLCDQPLATPPVTGGAAGG